jgi:hypothetical protein
VLNQDAASFNFSFRSRQAWSIPLQNDFEASTLDEVEQHEGRSGRALGSAFELGDVAGRDVEGFREDGLADVGLFAELANLIRGNLGNGRSRSAELPNDVVVAALIHHAAFEHVVCRCQNTLAEPADLPRCCLSHFPP